MSRKNKNGGRRNYSPRTYSRDFLKPTPIERAIQEANKPASPQAVAVSDRIACDDKCIYGVERIVNSFDPRLANEVKVSFRDGKFYVFDGAHTLSALKRIHGEDSFMVDCKVYYGLSYEDEAYLFALQSGESKDVAFNTRLRALMISGSQEATDFRAHTARAGFQLADGAGSATKNTIAAIAKAYRLYKEYGPEQYVQILQLIADTWNGAAWSVTGYLLGGVAVFLREYGEEYSRGRFIKRLRSATYETLRDEARRQQRGSSDVAHALAIVKLYNLTGGRGTVDPRRLTVLD